VGTTGGSASVPGGIGNTGGTAGTNRSGTAAPNSNFNASVQAARNGRTTINNQGVSASPFFSDPGARRQLNMTDAQFNRLNAAYRNAYGRYNQAASQLNPNLTEAQRMQQLQQLQNQFNSDMSGTLNNTFTDPRMLNRYNQLNRQFMGFTAFNDPAIRQQLNLTPDQFRQLRTLNNNWRQQLQQFRRGAGNNLGNVDQQQWTQMWQQYASQLNGVLTPAQQQTWSQLIGQPYAFSAGAYFNQPATGISAGATGTADTGAGTTGGTARTRAGTTTSGNVVGPSGTTTDTSAPNFQLHNGTGTQGTQPAGTQATKGGSTSQGSSTQR
jgi:hypothetical protein